jgi:hypothetical protein
MTRVRHLSGSPNVQQLGMLLMLASWTTCALHDLRNHRMYRHKVETSVLKATTVAQQLPVSSNAVLSLLFYTDRFEG